MKAADIAALAPDERRELLKRLLREKQEGERRYPLVAAQRSIWFLHRMAPESSWYNIGLSMRLSPPADGGALERAVARLTGLHRALRTVIVQDGAQPVQVVQEQSPVRVEEIDATGLEEARVYDMIQERFERPFNLQNGPLMQIASFRTAGDQILLLMFHHVVLDAWSIWIVIDELRRLYTEELTGERQDVPAPEAEYADFVKWQSELIDSAEGQRQWNYWKERLQPAPPTLNVPVDYSRGDTWKYRGKSLTLIVQGDEFLALKQIAQSRGTTLFNVLLAAWYVWLHDVTGQDDLLVGCPVSGRSEGRFDRTIGCFINTLPLRLRLAGNPNFEDVLKQVKHTLVEGLANQDYPFALTVQKLNPARDPSRPPLLETAFNHFKPQSRALSEQLFLTAFRSEPAAFGNSRLTFLPVPERQGYFDIGFEGIEVGEAIVGQFNYNSLLFLPGTAQQMLSRFHGVLQQIAINPDRRLLELLRPVECEREEIEL